MYLSKLELNPSRRETRRLLGNPQALHAVIMRAADPKPDRRVLWRIDEADASVTLYMTSDEVPDLEYLHDVAGWDDGVGQQSADYQPFLDRLTADDVYSFRLTANPTHMVTFNGEKKRTAHVTVEHQMKWLLQKAADNGFEALRSSLDDPRDPTQQAFELAVRDRSIVTFRRQGKNVTLARATFIGKLRVTDPRLMAEALVNGIGPAKAYGCGLMTLAK